MVTAAIKVMGVIALLLFLLLFAVRFSVGSFLLSLAGCGCEEFSCCRQSFQSLSLFLVLFIATALNLLLNCFQNALRLE
jgi:hypothetical protein